MAQINLDINLHDLTMMVLRRSEYASVAPELLAAEVSQRYNEVRQIILKELQQQG